MSKREHNDGYNTQKAGAYKSPGVSRLPMVDSHNNPALAGYGGDRAQLKQNFMHLRTNNNRSGIHSLDRTAGTGARNRGNYLPSTN